MFSRLVMRYTTMLERRPLVTRMVTTGTTAILGDALCQAVIEKKGLSEYDFARTLRLGVWAGFATGSFLHVWVKFLNRVSPLGGSNKVVSGLKRMALDMTVGFPIIIGGFFAGCSMLEGRNFTEISNKVKLQFWPTLKKGYVVFPIASILTHTLFPPTHHVLVINFLTLFWLVYLSSVQHSRPPPSAI